MKVLKSFNHLRSGRYIQAGADLPADFFTNAEKKRAEELQVISRAPQQKAPQKAAKATAEGEKQTDKGKA